MKNTFLIFLLLTLMSGCNEDEVESSNTVTITTAIITEITQTTAISGGSITNEEDSEIIEKGLCYSTLPNPTATDKTTSNGSGIGNFISHLTGLKAGTTYYVRAYATSSEYTVYGNEVHFTTDSMGNFPSETITVYGGSFDMGSNDGESNQQPIHSVTLNDFIMSKYEITNQQYADYMNAINANLDGSVNEVEYLDMDYSNISIVYISGSFVVKSGKENHPVIKVTWHGAKAYAEYYGGRLPTEAEWEFAARGGNNSNLYIYSGSDILNDVAWHYFNSGGYIHPIGTKNANELGLHDMSGSVREWTNDTYISDYYSNSPNNNPQGPNASLSYKIVTRGGSYSSGNTRCYVVYRGYTQSAEVSGANLGFRPVFTP